MKQYFLACKSKPPPLIIEGVFNTKLENEDAFDDDGKFLKGQAIATTMCCHNSDGRKYQITLQTELCGDCEEMNEEWGTRGHITIKYVDDYTQPFEYVPKENPAIINININGCINKHKCKYFDFSRDGHGDNCEPHGYAHIKKNMFKEVESIENSISSI